MGEEPVKILAAFLGLVFFLSPAIASAQSDLLPLEMGLTDPHEAIPKLASALKETQTEIQSLQTDAVILYNKADNSTQKTNDLERRLNDLVDHLSKIEDRLLAEETDIAELKVAAVRSGVWRPPHPTSGKSAASKSKAPINEGVTIDPRTGERMNATKYDAQGNPIQSRAAEQPHADNPKPPASKPKAAANKPKPTAEDGPH
jgi:septal ring factor EnvC (AmiA/AmiB activator)